MKRSHSLNEQIVNADYNPTKIIRSKYNKQSTRKTNYKCDVDQLYYQTNMCCSHGLLELKDMPKKVHTVSSNNPLEFSMGRFRPMVISLGEGPTDDLLNVDIAFTGDSESFDDSDELEIQVVYDPDADSKMAIKQQIDYECDAEALHNKSGKKMLQKGSMIGNNRGVKCSPDVNLITTENENTLQVGMIYNYQKDNTKNLLDIHKRGIKSDVTFNSKEPFSINRTQGSTFGDSRHLWDVEMKQSITHEIRKNKKSKDLGLSKLFQNVPEKPIPTVLDTSSQTNTAKKRKMVQSSQESKPKLEQSSEVSNQKPKTSKKVKIKESQNTKTNSEKQKVTKKQKGILSDNNSIDKKNKRISSDDYLPDEKEMRILSESSSEALSSTFSSGSSLFLENWDITYDVQHETEDIKYKPEDSIPKPKNKKVEKPTNIETKPPKTAEKIKIQPKLQNKPIKKQGSMSDIESIEMSEFPTPKSVKPKISKQPCVVEVTTAESFSDELTAISSEEDSKPEVKKIPPKKEKEPIKQKVEPVKKEPKQIYTIPEHKDDVVAVKKLPKKKKDKISIIIPTKIDEPPKKEEVPTKLPKKKIKKEKPEVPITSAQVPKAKEDIPKRDKTPTKIKKSKSPKVQPKKEDIPLTPNLTPKKHVAEKSPNKTKISSFSSEFQKVPDIPKVESKVKKEKKIKPEKSVPIKQKTPIQAPPTSPSSISDTKVKPSPKVVPDTKPVKKVKNFEPIKDDKKEVKVNKPTKTPPLKKTAPIPVPLDNQPKKKNIPISKPVVERTSSPLTLLVQVRDVKSSGSTRPPRTYAAKPKETPVSVTIPSTPVNFKQNVSKKQPIPKFKRKPMELQVSPIKITITRPKGKHALMSRPKSQPPPQIKPLITPKSQPQSKIKNKPSPKPPTRPMSQPIPRSQPQSKPPIPARPISQPYSKPKSPIKTKQSRSLPRRLSSKGDAKYIFLVPVCNPSAVGDVIDPIISRIMQEDSEKGTQMCEKVPNEIRHVCLREKRIVAAEISSMCQIYLPKGCKTIWYKGIQCYQVGVKGKSYDDIAQCLDALNVSVPQLIYRSIFPKWLNSRSGRWTKFDYNPIVRRYNSPMTMLRKALHVSTGHTMQNKGHRTGRLPDIKSSAAPFDIQRPREQINTLDQINNSDSLYKLKCSNGDSKLNCSLRSEYSSQNSDRSCLLSPTTDQLSYSDVETVSKHSGYKCVCSPSSTENLKVNQQCIKESKIKSNTNDNFDEKMIEAVLRPGQSLHHLECRRRVWVSISRNPQCNAAILQVPLQESAVRLFRHSRDGELQCRRLAMIGERMGVEFIVSESTYRQTFPIIKVHVNFSNKSKLMQACQLIASLL